ncbi:hypothetical protein ACWD4P_09625 [Kitasatospora sp. NPDC002543]
MTRAAVLGPLFSGPRGGPRPFRATARDGSGTSVVPDATMRPPGRSTGLAEDLGPDAVHTGPDAVHTGPDTVRPGGRTAARTPAVRPAGRHLEPA